MYNSIPFSSNLNLDNSLFCKHWTKFEKPLDTNISNTQDEDWRSGGMKIEDYLTIKMRACNTDSIDIFCDVPRGMVAQDTVQINGGQILWE